MDFATGNLVKVKNIKLPYANETGTVTGFVNQGPKRPRLLVLRLDHGYQSPKVGYKDIRYTAVIEENLVDHLPADTPRSYTKRVCEFCHKPCFSSLSPLIAHEINGHVICQHCEKSVFFDHETVTFVSVAEEIAQKRLAKKEAQLQRQTAKAANSKKRTGADQ